MHKVYFYKFSMTNNARSYAGPRGESKKDGKISIGELYDFYIRLKSD